MPGGGVGVAEARVDRRRRLAIDAALARIADDADALTVRVRTGVEAKAGGLSALVEGQGTLAVVDHYYDGLHGAQTRPLVADPQNVALYRAQLRYAGKGIALTAGRQRIQSTLAAPMPPSSSRPAAKRAGRRSRPSAARAVRTSSTAISNRRHTFASRW